MKIIPLSLLIFLSSCFHNSNDGIAEQKCNTDSSEIQGCWKTQDCFQEDTSEGDFWYKSEYEFTRNGEIKMGIYKYLESSCTGNFDLAVETSLLPSIAYEVSDDITSEEGIEGKNMTITIIWEDDSLSVTGVTSITDEEKLCYSPAFYLGSEKIVISESGTAKETGFFGNCLVRGKL